MKKRYFLLVLFMVFALTSCTDKAEAEEREESYAYGSVVSVADNQITLKEYTEEDEGEEREFEIVTRTELDNIDSIEELKKGDSAEIYYLEENGRFKATYVYKEEE